MGRALKPGDRVRLTLGGPVFRVSHVTRRAAVLTPEAARIPVEHYGRRFTVPLAGLQVSPRFVPAEFVDRTAG